MFLAILNKTRDNIIHGALINRCAEETMIEIFSLMLVHRWIKKGEGVEDAALHIQTHCSTTKLNLLYLLCEQVLFQREQKKHD